MHTTKKTRGGKASFERKRGSFIDRIAKSIPFESSEADKKTEKERKSDSELRMKLHNDIIELLNEDVSEDDAVKIIVNRFPDFPFAESRVHHEYEKGRNKTNQARKEKGLVGKKLIDKEGDER